MASRIAGFLILWISVPMVLRAQEPVGLRVAVGGMGSAYWGDYSEKTRAWTRFNPGFMLSLAMERQRLLQIQAQFGVGSITDQHDLGQPDLPAEVTAVPFIATDFVLGEVRLRVRPIRQGPIQPYAAAGLGFMSFSPRDERGRFLADAFLTRLTGEDYPTLTVQTPLSVGVDVRLSPLATLGAEYTLRFTGTDYLDNTGRLGQRPGNDRVHGPTLWLALNLSARPEPVVPPVEPLPPPTPPDQIWNPFWDFP